MRAKSAKEATEAAIRAIDRRGCLLVFPVDNRKEFASIWSEFYPRSLMRWEWDEGDKNGDDRVWRLWHLRMELSLCRKVVYTKWFKGRATFLSRPVFVALLRRLGSERGLSREAREILKALRMDSPLSTKELKRATGLQGRLNESTYQRALKELWSRMLIVGYGEVDDGAFPSLAVGATQIIFEDLYNEARELSEEKALQRLKKTLGEISQPFKQALKIEAALAKAAAQPVLGALGNESAKQDMDTLEY